MLVRRLQRHNSSRSAYLSKCKRPKIAEVSPCSMSLFVCSNFRSSIVRLLLMRDAFRISDNPTVMKQSFHMSMQALLIAMEAHQSSQFFFPAPSSPMLYMHSPH